MITGCAADPGACDRMRTEKAEGKDGNPRDFKRKLGQKCHRCAGKHNKNRNLNHFRASEKICFFPHIDRAERSREIDNKNKTDHSLRQMIRSRH